MYTADERHQRAFSALGDSFYWQAGKYELVLSISTSGPSRVFERRWAFDLSEEESKTLKLNIMNILDLPLAEEAGFDAPTWFFAYVDYQDA